MSKRMSKRAISSSLMAGIFAAVATLPKSMRVYQGHDLGRRNEVSLHPSPV